MDAMGRKVGAGGEMDAMGSTVEGGVGDGGG